MTIAAAFALMMTMAGAAWAQGADWSSVTTAQSKVRLDLPETEGRGIFLRSQTESYSATRHLARYPTNAHKLDGAVLLYVELAPGYHFKTPYEVNDVIEWTRKAGTIDLGRRMSVQTPRGPMSVRLFSLDNRIQCGAFSQTWGQGGSMTTSAGTHRLTGYMCDESGDTVTEERVEEAAAAIVISD